MLLVMVYVTLHDTHMRQYAMKWAPELTQTPARLLLTDSSQQTHTPERASQIFSEYLNTFNAHPNSKPLISPSTCCATMSQSRCAIAVIAHRKQVLAGICYITICPHFYPCSDCAAATYWNRAAPISFCSTALVRDLVWHWPCRMLLLVGLAARAGVLWLASLLSLNRITVAKKAG